MNHQVPKLVLSALLAAAGLSSVAAAGTLAGKVDGAGAGSVVYLDTIAGKTFPPPATPVVIDQRGLIFRPHVSVVPQGGTVAFLNSDKVAHNIFWPAVGGNRKLSHNLGTWPSGQNREFKFDTPGVVPLLCNVHSEMSAYLLVIPTPYYAITDGSGTYRITDVPDGQYNVQVWHEGMKPQMKPAKVVGDAHADFTLAK